MEKRLLEQRKRKNLTLKHKIYIFCNGPTEKNYFDELRGYHRIKKELCVISSSHSNRLSLVKEVAETHGNIKKDKTKEIYVVFDADIMPKGRNSNPSTIKSQVDNACSQCVAKGYTAIVSNESFELWYLLHFENINIKTHRDDLFQKVQAHISDYEKAKFGILEKTLPFIDTAKERAIKLDANYPQNVLRSERNPSTNVYELIEKIESLKSISL